MVLVLAFGGILVAFARGSVVDWVSAKPSFTPRNDTHHEDLRRFAETCAGAREILAIHSDPDSMFTDMVLWRFDSDEDDLVDVDEIDVISHHRALRTVQIFRVDNNRGIPVLIEPRASTSLDENDASPFNESFCDRWRSSAWVESTCIATEVSDLLIDLVESTDNREARCRIKMIWTANPADSVDEGAVEFRATLRGEDDWETVQ